VRLTYDNEPLKERAGQRSGPVAVYENERPRSGWAEILLLAERLAAEPLLIPTDPFERALVFGLAHEICGESGLGWSRRLQLVHAGLNGARGFSEPVSKYLGKKYGYSPEAGAAVGARVAELLRMLAGRLKSQHRAGSRYYVGNSLTAVDVYSATFTGDVRPAPVRAVQDGGEHSRRLREPRRADRSGARSDPFRTSGHDVREQPGDATLTLSLFRRTRRAAPVRHECAD
jgi:glutathione S-transferase